MLHAKIGVIAYLTPLGSLQAGEAREALRQCSSARCEQGECQQVIDLSRGATLSSAVLELLLDIQEQLGPRGGSLRIANASDVAGEVLQFTGVCELVELTEAGPRWVQCKSSEAASGLPRLGDILLQRGQLSEQQLAEVIELQQRLGKRMGQIVTERGWVSETHLLEALSLQMGLHFINLRPGLFDPMSAQLVDAATCERLGVVPLFKLRSELLVATADPQDMPALDELEELTGLHIKSVLACREAIERVIGLARADSQLSDLQLIGEAEQDLEVMQSPLPEDYAQIDEMAQGSPVVNMVNAIIQRAVCDGVSDIHIEPGRGHAKVRYRIDGVLYQVLAPRMELIPAMVSRLKVMANLDIAERRLPQDGRIQVQTKGKAVDLRFSSLPGLYGEKVVLRILDKNQALLDVNKLGMDERNLQAYKRLLSRSYGLILVTGPTGSGKTTSLYAAINELNSIEKNIVTIEDPVEYQIDVVNQNEVRERIGLTFAKLLKHVLRQDPDIVLVGEIRDRETAEIAVQAALTGHLVLSTLHTNNSCGAITRMIDMGIEPYLLASALVGVVAQRLVRRICSHCKSQYLAPVELCSHYGWPQDGTVKLARGRGCEKCYDSGYRSRLGIHEILPATSELQQLIIKNPSLESLQQYMREQQIASLFEDGLARVREQLTSVEEIARVVNS
ncbi:ATPase, T2SS/T4P/T4SS family [Pseudomonas benzenivorans]|uniref:Flp pilus assembly complex ATPase component TadA n=1 Tax=Pseudomonas benzenivorans TaxID=556533 RepID=A0ABY5H6S9_9PSED|nr:ATPase, T2SS/T4P/T4SS family [Pseudomonas benzenivorans]UTW07127.1 Flp pilus assembly complex ATPase component TadA [Pseudomonas benzenivorans]